MLLLLLLFCTFALSLYVDSRACISLFVVSFSFSFFVAAAIFCGGPALPLVVVDSIVVAAVVVEDGNDVVVVGVGVAYHLQWAVVVEWGHKCLGVVAI